MGSACVPRGVAHLAEVETAVSRIRYSPAGVTVHSVGRPSDDATNQT